ncbi:MAG: hypothetical protein HYY49_12825 [Ignavibacteriales bacterium]|nr:hypothetical protein [Ignavibacteriales bacterium]
MKKSRKITPKESLFSQDQSWELERFAIDEISAIGNIDLLKTTKLGFLCSVRCPAKVIVKTQEYLRSAKVKGTVVSGFHSPIEREGLRILFQKESPTIACPALSIDSFKVPTEWEPKIEAGKLLVLSMFPKQYKRFDARLAYQRNKFVSLLADKMLIPFADKGSKTLELIRFMISKGKSVSAFDVAENTHLFALGVKRI